MQNALFNLFSFRAKIKKTEHYKKTETVFIIF